MDRTSQLDVQRGPTTMRFTKGNHGNVRMNMQRHHEYVCVMVGRGNKTGYNLL